MSTMTTLHIKIPNGAMKKIDKIIVDRDYHSCSEFVRECIRKAIDMEDKKKLEIEFKRILKKAIEDKAFPFLKLPR